MSKHNQYQGLLFDQKTMNQIIGKIKIFDEIISQVSTHDFTLATNDGYKMTFPKASLSLYIPYFDGLFNANMSESTSSIVNLDYTKNEVYYILFLAVTGSVFTREEIIYNIINRKLIVDFEDWLSRVNVAFYFGLTDTYYKEWFSKMLTCCVDSSNTNFELIESMLDLGLDVSSLDIIILKTLEKKPDLHFMKVLFDHKNYGIGFLEERR